MSDSTAATVLERKGVVIRNKLDHTKFWGVVYEDGGGPGGSITYGWVDLNKASIHDPRYVTKPSDVTWRDSPYAEGLDAEGEFVPMVETKIREVVVKVERTLT